MGFLSFLTRRSGDKTKSKSRPQDAIPPKPAQAPLPVKGSPAAAEAASRGRPLTRQPREPYDDDAVIARVTKVAEAAAPAPPVSLYREESPERPSTAPNGSQSNTVWLGAGARLRKNPLRGAPPVSFRMVRPTTANPLARPVSHSGTEGVVAGTSQVGSQAALAQTHSRSNSFSNSMRSDGGKGYKDLLDAQSEIKPADFRTRVRASGARDYGEDVADRNLGENGFDLTSPQVQAFYAHSSSLRPADDYHPSSGVTIGDTRTKSLTASSNFPFPNNKATAHIPLVPRVRSTDITDPNSPLLRRRQSVNTYMPSKSRGSESDLSSSKKTGGHRTTSNPIRLATSHDGEKPSWDLPTLPALGLPSPIAMERPKTARPATSRSPRSPRTPRDSVVVAKQRAGTAIVDHRVDDTILINHHPDERFYPVKSSPRSHRGSVISPAKTSPRKRHSLHTLQPSASYANRDFVFDATPLTYPRPKHQHSIKHQAPGQDIVASIIDNMTIDFDVASSPTKPVDPTRSHFHRSPFTIHEIQEVAETEPGVGDMPLDSAKGGIPDDKSEQATLRTRSLRGWSTSSATPTTSDTSSNPFHRPQSRHTANTSIDLSLGVPSLKKVPSHASLDSGTAMSPKIAKSSNFNIDDYVSSDDDCFTEPRRPRGEGEEELLFSDIGYGAIGFQLPGLPEPLPTTGGPKEKQLLQHARSSISLPLIYDYDSFGRANGRRFILDTAADSDEEDGPYPKDASPLRYLRNTKRLSAICGSPLKQYGSAPEVIVEERTGKVDVAAAVRMRKEAKARKRASGISLARPRRARPAVPLGAVEAEGPVDDEANHADVEL